MLDHTKPLQEYETSDETVKLMSLFTRSANSKKNYSQTARRHYIDA